VKPVEKAGPAKVPVSSAKNDYVIESLADFRSKFDKLRVEVFGSFMQYSHPDTLASVQNDSYKFIASRVSKKEAELFADRTNLLVPNIKAATELKEAVAADCATYSTRIGEVINRILTGQTLKD
jgi:hypothetical protein